ncbi:uncharacterized protein Z518_00392 [Rhinocladiella mackenziei CBS 650.93]|uniref:Rhinocladiella mackenziei CBS 650.93 unplaced genomic scaffold supercont1.1, whole genome shotgun sequence n=1 Tax=Rhinocladiella mackenziei CBS 650.93 TaxID=1442369 RepID=A0A0D2HF32_9EURO|nr:uncharacterized protein Z518_00392 [Rhinocladiella mackenziei CBS 650.93]KIX09313.1 hypothetical protein Z518_00392 [Rhinocladiella mackenziei CBS 650.93]
MAPSPQTQHNKGRMKLLHRFYEPLVLLYVLDKVQGDHFLPNSDRLPLNDAPPKELRRRFLSSLSYICDYKKGGDTITAIGAASNPLTYYVACNKGPKDRVKPFLESILTKLGLIFELDKEQRKKVANEILDICAEFSKKRIETYWDFLRGALMKCGEALQDDSARDQLREMKEKLTECSEKPTALCRFCSFLMRPDRMTFIKERARITDEDRNYQSSFAIAKHYIGRLAFHVKVVKVFMEAAIRIPELFVDPQVMLLKSPQSLIGPPPLRNKLTLDGLVNRMASTARDSLPELRSCLKALNHQFDIERIVRQEYDNKNFKPRVHAELIVLEHFYQNRNTLQYLGNDPYVGCSKPACYCCSLYIREHPAGFDPPATHQKIYLNWLPPTSTESVQVAGSDAALHEKTMLNKIVQSIRQRTMYQIKTQSGKRQCHPDSVTGDTFSTRIISSIQELINPDGEEDDDDVDRDVTAVARDFEHWVTAREPDEDSEGEGGVQLP